MTNNKYQIGQTYILKVFMEPEEMEYLGEIVTLKYNGNSADIKFDVFRRYSFGSPDLFALYGGKFFTRSYNNTVEDLTKEVGKAFGFVGKGYLNVLVGDIPLSIDEFREQVNGLLTEKETENAILNGRFSYLNRNGGEIKWRPSCKRIKQTSCTACGCGSCQTCGHRWACFSGRSTPTMIMADGLSL